MTINFPNSPAVNDTYTLSGKRWQWNGTGWQLIGTFTLGNYLDAIQSAGLTHAASKFMWWNASNAAELKSLTAFAITLLDDADAATMRSTLGVAIGTDVQAYDADLTTWAAASLTTRGDLVRRGASSIERVALGSTGQVLQSDGTDAVWGNAGGMQLLTSGDISSQATLDIPLAAYTAYRTIIVELYGVIPVTDGVNLHCQLSTDNGSNWLASTYHHACGGVVGGGYLSTTGSESDSKIVISNTSANGQIGNVSNEGIHVTVKIQGWQLTTLRPRITWDGNYWSNAATTIPQRIFGGGGHDTAQDMTAFRFAFSSGNMSSGKYAVYGLL